MNLLSQFPILALHMQNSLPRLPTITPGSPPGSFVSRKAAQRARSPLVTGTPGSLEFSSMISRQLVPVSCCPIVRAEPRSGALGRRDPEPHLRGLSASPARDNSRKILGMLTSEPAPFNSQDSQYAKRAAYVREPASEGQDRILPSCDRPA